MSSAEINSSPGGLIYHELASLSAFVSENALEVGGLGSPALRDEAAETILARVPQAVKDELIPDAEPTFETLRVLEDALEGVFQLAYGQMQEAFSVCPIVVAVLAACQHRLFDPGARTVVFAVGHSWLGSLEARTIAYHLELKYVRGLAYACQHTLPEWAVLISSDAGRQRIIAVFGKPPETANAAIGGSALDLLAVLWKAPYVPPLGDWREAGE